MWLGDVRRKSRHNSKGNRENFDILNLNEAVLMANGATWDEPPQGPVTWAPEHRVQRDRLIASFPTDRAWGFKDPRTLFTLDGWRAALPAARLVGSLRHPVAVARSLTARSGMDTKTGISLWTAYNCRLLSLVKAEDIPVVSFDHGARLWRSTSARVIRDLGLQVPDEDSDFFDDTLRHQTGEDIPLPEDTMRLYDALCERALS